MSQNFIQLNIPVEHAELVFTALVDQYGIQLNATGENGEATDADLEAGAKKALAKACDNAVTEHLNRLALKQAQDNKPDLGIS